MIEKLKNWIASIIINRKYNKRKLEIIKFNGFFENAKNFLIILPENPVEFSEADNLIKYLEEKGKRYDIFVQSDYSEYIPNWKYGMLYVFEPAYLSKLNLPNNVFLSKFENIEYDAVIDLCSFESSFYKILLLSIHSKIFIGMSENNSGDLYNFQIKTSENSEFSYEKLLNSLKMF